MKRFKALTWGKPLVMGRKTFDSIGRALPGRETIVVTRDPPFAPPGVLVAHDLDAGLALAAERASVVSADEIIIGGGEIYAQRIARASRVFITEVALDAEGEARFPSIDPHAWQELSRERAERGARDDADFAFGLAASGWGMRAEDSFLAKQSAKAASTRPRREGWRRPAQIW